MGENNKALSGGARGGANAPPPRWFQVAQTTYCYLLNAISKHGLSIEWYFQWFYADFVMKL